MSLTWFLYAVAFVFSVNGCVKAVLAGMQFALHALGKQEHPWLCVADAVGNIALAAMAIHYAAA